MYTTTIQGLKGTGQQVSFSTPPHCKGQWAVGIPLHIAALQVATGKWAVGILECTTALHGSVGTGDPSVHLYTAALQGPRGSG